MAEWSSRGDACIFRNVCTLSVYHQQQGKLSTARSTLLSVSRQTDCPSKATMIYILTTVFHH